MATLLATCFRSRVKLYNVFQYNVNYRLFLTLSSCQKYIVNREHVIASSSAYQGKRFFFKLLRKKNPRYYFRKDNMKDDYDLVYHCANENYAIVAQLVSQFTGVAFVLLSCLTVYQNMTGSLPSFEDSTFVQSGAEQAIYFASGMILSVMVCAATQIYPLRIYHNEKTKEFTFIFQSLEPLKIRKAICLEGQVKQASPWFQKYGVYQMNNRKVYLDGRAFRLPYYYNLLLGYKKEM